MNADEKVIYMLFAELGYVANELATILEICKAQSIVVDLQVVTRIKDLLKFVREENMEHKI